jgi:uncharacterized protein
MGTTPPSQSRTAAAGPGRKALIERGVINALLAAAASGPPSAPELCFGTVVHQRLRPTAHRFAYRVFFLRIPLSQLDGLSNRWLSRERFNLLSFYARDYGPRDGSDLIAWARARLAAAGRHDIDGEIVVQTFPRLLGYVFNPISIWYCYDRAGVLRAAICEVSNTFGERHDYVLNPQDHAPIAATTWLTATKQLHVSPFCEVRGHYRFRFEQLAAHCSAHIDYYDSASDDLPLLLTTIAGTPTALNARATLRAFCGYPLFTLGVVARIHLQAFKLWRKRVPWFRKPPPPSLETSP